MAHTLGSKKMASASLFITKLAGAWTSSFNSGQHLRNVIFNFSVIDIMNMKPIFAIALLAMAVLPSCVVRENPPLDPTTMRPSCKFCPQNYYAGHPSACSACGRVVTKTTVTTK